MVLMADPVESAAKGAAKAAIEYSEDKIKDFLRKFANGELAFIEDEETIQIVKTQRKTPEWHLYRDCVKNPDLRLQIQAGFSLRQLEGNPKKLQDFRSKLVKRFGKKGLHIAELAQNGLLTRYIGLIIGHAADEKELAEVVENLLHDIEKYVVFIQQYDNPKNIAKTLIIRIQALVPNALILFSKGKTATKIAAQIIGMVEKSSVSGYRIETQFEYESNQRYDYIIKSE